MAKERGKREREEQRALDHEICMVGIQANVKLIENQGGYNKLRFQTLGLVRYNFSNVPI